MATMDEQAWLASSDPLAMLGRLTVRPQATAADRTWSRASDRKLRLFAVACCRQVWHLLTDPRSRWAVEVAERFADGEAMEGELQAAAISAYECAYGHPPGQLNPADRPADQLASAAALVAGRDEEAWRIAAGRISGLGFAPPAAQAALLREIFGNPFRPVRVRTFGGLLVQDWLLSPAVVALARTLYEQRTWAELPILADALEEAGCPAELRWQNDKGGPLPDFCGPNTILSHLRGPGPHVRGCWAVDAILGRE